MPTLYLLRHAKAAAEPAALDRHGGDFSRPLTERGLVDAKQMGKKLLPIAADINQILCSAARRCTETWEQLNTPWREHGVVPPPTSFEKGLYLCGMERWLEEISLLKPQAQHILLIGHNPDMQELALWLSEASLAQNKHSELRQKIAEKYPTCGFTELHIDNLAELRRGCAQIRAFIRPKDLD